jgi:hypothetical protein
MGQAFTEKEASYGDFTVTKSNPSGNIVRFTVTDTANLLTLSKQIRMVLNDAIQQWIDLERADLDTNGDSTVKGAEEFVGVGDGFSQFTYNFSGKWAQVTLTALTSISSSGTLTVSIPYADVV